MGMALWLAPALCGAPGRNHPTSQEGTEYLQPPQSRFKFIVLPPHFVLFHALRHVSSNYVWPSSFPPAEQRCKRDEHELSAEH